MFIFMRNAGNGYGYRHLHIHRVHVRMLVPEEVWARIRGFFPTTGMWTNTIIRYPSPTHCHPCYPKMRVIYIASPLSSPQSIYHIADQQSYHMCLKSSLKKQNFITFCFFKKYGTCRVSEFF